MRTSSDAGLDEVLRSFAVFVEGSWLAPDDALEVSVRWAQESAPRPHAPGFANSCHFGSVLGFTSERSLELWDGHSAATASLDGTSVSASVSRRSEPHSVGAVLLFTAAAVALRASGAFHLHGAGLQIDGLGSILIVGESGAGKTTVALGLCHLGGRLCSDDAMFLRALHGGAIQAVGWPRHIHATADTLRAFPELHGYTFGRISDGREKFVVSGASLGPMFPHIDDPELLLFPHVTGAPLTVATRLTQSDVMQRLLPASGLLAVPGAAKAAEHMELLGSLASRAVGIDLALGTDVVGAPDRLFRLVAAQRGRR